MIPPKKVAPPVISQESAPVGHSSMNKDPVNLIITDLTSGRLNTLNRPSTNQTVGCNKSQLERSMSQLDHIVTFEEKLDQQQNQEPEPIERENEFNKLRQNLKILEDQIKEDQ